MIIAPLKILRRGIELLPCECKSLMVNIKIYFNDGQFASENSTRWEDEEAFFWSFSEMRFRWKKIKSMGAFRLHLEEDVYTCLQVIVILQPLSKMSVWMQTDHIARINTASFVLISFEKWINILYFFKQKLVFLVEALWCHMHSVLFTNTIYFGLFECRRLFLLLVWVSVLFFNFKR